jgi:hypothetical protein
MSTRIVVCLVLSLLLLFWLQRRTDIVHAKFLQTEKQNEKSALPRASSSQKPSPSIRRVPTRRTSNRDSRPVPIYPREATIAGKASQRVPRDTQDNLSRGNSK